MSRAPLAGRAAYRHWTTIPTRWADNDVYGHVNNTVYYQWMDTAVNRWLIAAGLLDIATSDPIALVVETGCRYAAPLAYPEDVEVGVAVTALGRSSVTYGIGIFAAGAAHAAAEGRFTHVYVGRTSRRPVPLPDAWRALLEGLRAGAQP